MVKRLYWASCDGLLLGDTKEASPPLFPRGMCISLGTALIGLKKFCSIMVKSSNSLGFAETSLYKNKRKIRKQ